jgi:hypothetical protein
MVVKNGRQDWQKFKQLLRAELKELGATRREEDIVVGIAWLDTADLDDFDDLAGHAARYAADELEMVRDTGLIERLDVLC